MLKAALYDVKSNLIYPGMTVRPSVPFLTGAVVGADSVGTIRSHITSMACNEALVGTYDIDIEYFRESLSVWYLRTSS